MSNKRAGWNGNEADREERQKPVESDLLTNPAYWDICDQHRITFPMGDRCPKCQQEYLSGDL